MGISAPSSPASRAGRLHSLASARSDKVKSGTCPSGRQSRPDRQPSIATRREETVPVEARHRLLPPSPQLKRKRSRSVPSQAQSPTVPVYAPQSPQGKNNRPGGLVAVRALVPVIHQLIHNLSRLCNRPSGLLTPPPVFAPHTI